MTDDGALVRRAAGHPRFRGHLHTWAALLSVPAGIMLIMSATSTSARVGASIYAVSLLALFGTSASYHRIARSVGARVIMQRLDHAMIFVLIAGTYTPLCLLAMPTRWGRPTLVAVWTGALLGIVLKVVAFNRLKVLHHALYPMLGWAAIVTLPVLYRTLSPIQLACLVAGGVVYTLGVPVLVQRRPDPWPLSFGYHEVWHVFTFVATTFHFALIAMLVGAG
jgi:hemolysin III